MESVQEESNQELHENPEEPSSYSASHPSSAREDGEQPHEDISPDEPAETSPMVSPPPPPPPPQAIIPHSSDIAQMEAFLLVQQLKCDYYKKTFEKQSNTTLANQFETYSTLTHKDLDMLRTCWREGGRVPKFKFETIRITSVPTNVEVKEKELHVVVRTSNLPVARDSVTYVIGEFEFPLAGKEETVGEKAGRWLKNIKIEPKKLFCCPVDNSRQLDIVYSTTTKPFHDPDSYLVEYDRPMQFYVDKGRSRSFRRKFKPIKLNFFKKTSVINWDRKLGSVQVKIDSINDEATLNMRASIMNGRKMTEAVADIKVRVREPLVDKTPKTHEEKILVLT